MITLRCVVERITYQNPENGYTVLRAAVRNYKELVTVVGNLLDVNVGSVLLLQGGLEGGSQVRESVLGGEMGGNHAGHRLRH